MSRTVVVTGSASGIGAATVARLERDGVTVIGADIVDGVDVSDEASVDAFWAGVEGRVDGLVHSAGVAGGGAVHQLELAEWRRVIDVNLTGTFLMARGALRRMVDQERDEHGERGAIVTLASIEGLEGTAGGSTYNASKGGVVLLTKNIAIDYGGLGIRANAICPGFVDTPLMASVVGMPGMEAFTEGIIREHKLGRRAQPEEIASVAAFLLSHDASFLTGAAVPVDGGYTAGRDHHLTDMLGLRG